MPPGVGSANEKGGAGLEMTRTVVISPRLDAWTMADADATTMAAVCHCPQSTMGGRAGLGVTGDLMTRRPHR